MANKLSCLEFLDLNFRRCITYDPPMFLALIYGAYPPRCVRLEHVTTSMTCFFRIHCLSKSEPNHHYDRGSIQLPRPWALD